MSARHSFSSGSRLFQSYRSYSREPRSNGADGLAPSERVDALATGVHRGLALEDHVERRSRETLAQNALVLREVTLLERVGDSLQLRARQIREDREARERLGDVVGCGPHDGCLGRAAGLGKRGIGDNAGRMSAGRGLPAGTLTFLFTDIEGSTKLQTGLGTDRYHEVLETHTRLLRQAFKDDGVEIRVDGDALFVVFAVAAKAVRATAAAQRALAQVTFPHGATLRVRMGMHTGEGRPASAESGADYVGIDVNRAARVAAAGHGGQGLLTQATALLAKADPRR